MKKIFAAILFLGFLWACSSDGGEVIPPVDGVPDDPKEEVSFERGPLLTNWADNIIIPSYEAFDTELNALNTSFDTFRTSANPENLIALRAAWLKTYTLWQRVSMFEIGPAESEDFRFSMNTYPTNVEKIENNIASSAYDLSLSSNREAKGFPALDYLINGLGETDEVIVSKYATGDNQGLIEYTAAVLDDMQTKTTTILVEWKGSYKATFVSNDGASATASVDRFVNDYIFYFEKFLRAGKMGIPLGVFSADPFPDKVEAFYNSEVSNELFLEGLQASQDFFNGKHFSSDTTGESLASYLDALNTVKDGEDLKTIINNQFDKARDRVTSLNTFRTEIENNTPPTDMLMAYDEVQRLVPLMKVDMVSAMSISIDFVDADGD
ncbi:MAG: imelysin family protein [Maribacter sp.]